MTTTVKCFSELRSFLRSNRLVWSNLLLCTEKNIAKMMTKVKVILKSFCVSFLGKISLTGRMHLTVLVESTTGFVKHLSHVPVTLKTTKAFPWLHVEKGNDRKCPWQSWRGRWHRAPRHRAGTLRLGGWQVERYNAVCTWLHLADRIWTIPEFCDKISLKWRRCSSTKEVVYKTSTLFSYINKTSTVHQQNINNLSTSKQKNINHQPFVNENIKQSSTQHHHINL